MRKSPGASEEIKKKDCRKKKSTKSYMLQERRRHPSCVWMEGAGVLWVPLVGLSDFERSPVNPCQMEDAEADGLSSQ